MLAEPLGHPQNTQYAAAQVLRLSGTVNRSVSIQVTWHTMVAVLQPLAKGKYIAIDRAVVMVGRSADCDAIIASSKKISRRHCCLVQVDNHYYVRDLGSMNGVWLNGSRVEREAQIGHGDKLTIGDVEFLFHPNARIEQKRTVSPVVADLSAKPKAVAVPAKDLPTIDAFAEDAAGKPSRPDQVEILESVVELEEELLATNEIEIVDDPIIDEGDDDYLEMDEIVVYDD